MLVRSRSLRASLLYALVVGAMYAVPLLRVLHAESSALVAAVGWGVAGGAALAAFRRGEAFAPVLRRHLALLLVPWALLTATLPWAPNAGYAQGLLLFVTFAPPSVALAVALAYALTGPGARRSGRRFAGITLLLLVVTPLYDLGLHAQFYHYNHVFGGILGPIYDEELALRPGLFAFRGLTLLWALGAFLHGEARRGRRQPGRMRAALALVGATYALGGWLGFNTPAWALRRALDGHVRTPHFDVYFDAATTDSAGVARLVRLHEYRYAQLYVRLGVGVGERVQSFVYPDARTRARLTGAARTSVAPVWLSTPQVHVLAASLDAVLAHELAHAFSREFGLPLLHASRFVGLVEGLAVATEPPDGLPTPDEQVIAAALADGQDGLARRVADALGPGGFWTGRGAVSYTTTGSFVRYLLDRYGAAKLRAVYAWGDFEGVYGRPLPVLTAEWEAHLMHLRLIARAAAPLAERRFSVPSLFEKRSPHYVPRYVRLTRRAEAASGEASGTAEARRLVEAALAAAPDYAPALDLWARLLLRAGQPEAVHARLAPHSDLPPRLLMRRADALALVGRADAARADYAAAGERLPLYAHPARVALALRAALAATPAAVAALYDGTAQTATGPAPARLLEAVQHLEAHPAAALDALGTERLAPGFWTTAGAAALFDAQRRAWRAEAALAAGRYEVAEAEGARAAGLFAHLADANAAAAWLDVARQARWAQRGALPVPAKPSRPGKRE